MTLEQHIERLNKLDADIASLNYMEALFGWDSMTLAPDNGIEERSFVIGKISAIYFSTLINNEVKETLDVIHANLDCCDDITAAKAKLYKREYTQIASIPKHEYAAFRELVSKSNRAWEDAKDLSDFKLFAPYLKDIIATLKRFIAYRGYEGHPYNTLLDDYEPGLNVETCDLFFDNLRKSLVPLIHSVKNEVHQYPFLNQKFDINKQMEFSDYIAEAIGFNMDSGVIAESTHPFTINLSRNDVRITTRFFEEDLQSAIASTIHESGHAMYEQNISEEFGVSSLTTGVSMGIHESQSRIYENNFGRSYSFWEMHFPKLQQLFINELGDVTTDEFYRSLNTIKPSLIRIDADEVTYPLHIMVRYEIEKMLFSEELNVEELPRIWNEKYKEYLGVAPSNDSEGILQDVHWSEGLFGYFPSYALGSAYAAQFEAYMRKDLDVDNLLKSGDMLPILNWLTERIHQYGSSKTPADIIKIATGKNFDPQYFTNYLYSKFSKIYNLN